MFGVYISKELRFKHFDLFASEGCFMQIHVLSKNIYFSYLTSVLYCINSDVLGTPLIDSGIASQLRPGDDSDLTDGASDLEGSVIENLSKKWREISYTHADAVTADHAPSLSADPATADLFRIDRDDDSHAQVNTGHAHLFTHDTLCKSKCCDHLNFQQISSLKILFIIGDFL